MSFIKGYTKGEVKYPVVATALNFSDLIGTIKVRWAINRNNYRVKPGLYAVGTPDSSSEVYVSANYKLSFDHLRKNLDGLNCWILVIDTKGINVWCAAGKGTFGTKELVNRVQVCSLEKVVSHRRLIVPQLGAVGVSAHEVKEQTGFRVAYGPVRASDIKNFVQAGYKTDREMRTVKFNLYDRLILTPVEIVGHLKYFLPLLAVLFLLSGFRDSRFTTEMLTGNGLKLAVCMLSAYIGGAVIAPLLLPILPSRRFAVKGIFLGILLSVMFYLTGFAGDNIIEAVSLSLIMISITSFMTMNFTGTSTYTSLSGVTLEMKTAVPLQIFLMLIGLLTWIGLRFI